MVPDSLSKRMGSKGPTQGDWYGGVPTIAPMLTALNALVAPAAMERLTLVINHILSGEPAAAARLQLHRGRCIALHLVHWPQRLPAPPTIVFRVTPAGLLEWESGGQDLPADLRVVIDASNPALLALRWLSGDAPPMDIQGDAAFAADVHWLADNLRWDLAADLERVVGPVAAHELARFGRVLAAALRKAVQLGGEVAGRLRPVGRQS